MTVALLIAALVLLAALSQIFWQPAKRFKMARLLRDAATTNELAKGVGSLGVVLPLTNDNWIAIRYEDTHSALLFGIRSCAIARDSGGKWFTSSRHFCGRLAAWPDLKKQSAAQEEEKRLSPESFTNTVLIADKSGGIFPSFREMMEIEHAPDLEAARRALRKIGFNDYTP